MATRGRPDFRIFKNEPYEGAYGQYFYTIDYGDLYQATGLDEIGSADDIFSISEDEITNQTILNEGTIADCTETDSAGNLFIKDCLVPGAQEPITDVKMPYDDEDNPLVNQVPWFRFNPKRNIQWDQFSTEFWTGYWQYVNPINGSIGGGWDCHHDGKAFESDWDCQCACDNGQSSDNIADCHYNNNDQCYGHCVTWCDNWTTWSLGTVDDFRPLAYAFVGEDESDGLNVQRYYESNSPEYIETSAPNLINLKLAVTDSVTDCKSLYNTQAECEANSGRGCSWVLLEGSQDVNYGTGAEDGTCIGQIVTDDVVTVAPLLGQECSTKGCDAYNNLPTNIPAVNPNWEVGNTTGEQPGVHQLCENHGFGAFDAETETYEFYCVLEGTHGQEWTCNIPESIIDGLPAGEVIEVNEEIAIQLGYGTCLPYDVADGTVDVSENVLDCANYQNPNYCEEHQDDGCNVEWKYNTTCINQSTGEAVGTQVDNQICNETIELAGNDLYGNDYTPSIPCGESNDECIDQSTASLCCHICDLDGDGYCDPDSDFCQNNDCSGELGTCVDCPATNNCMCDVVENVVTSVSAECSIEAADGLGIDWGCLCECSNGMLYEAGECPANGPDSSCDEFCSNLCGNQEPEAMSVEFHQCTGLYSNFCQEFYANQNQCPEYLGCVFEAPLLADMLVATAEECNAICRSDENYCYTTSQHSFNEIIYPAGVCEKNLIVQYQINPQCGDGSSARGSGRDVCGCCVDAGYFSCNIGSSGQITINDSTCATQAFAPASFICNASSIGNYACECGCEDECVDQAEDDDDGGDDGENYIFDPEDYNNDGFWCRMNTGLNWYPGTAEHCRLVDNLGVENLHTGMDICMWQHSHNADMDNGGVPGIREQCENDWANVSKMYCCGICNDTDEVGAECTVQEWNSFGEPCQEANVGNCIVPGSLDIWGNLAYPYNPNEGPHTEYATLCTFVEPEFKFCEDFNNDLASCGNTEPGDGGEPIVGTSCDNCGYVENGTTANSAFYCSRNAFECRNNYDDPDGEYYSGDESADKLLVPDCAKYIGFVVNWDWRDGDPEDWGDIIDDFPRDGFEAFERARRFDTYDYIDLAEMEAGERWFTHQYNTYGVKIIKAVVFSYVENPYNHLIQAMRWKLLTVRLVLGIDDVFIEDFGILGGYDYNFIPFPILSPVIGGISENSAYSKSVDKIYNSNLFQPTEIIDKDLAEKAYKNDNLGVFPGKVDIEQVRLFNKPFDMHNLLHIEQYCEQIYDPNYKYVWEPYGEYYPADFEFNHNFWDGKNNKFPEETSVGSLFIDEAVQSIREACLFEYNLGNATSTIRDTSGNYNTGVLIGDYGISKTSKQMPLRRERSMKLPKTDTEDGAI